MAIGTREELERIVQQFTEDLTKDMYRQSRKNFKRKCIEFKVTCFNLFILLQLILHSSDIVVFYVQIR